MRSLRKASPLTSTAASGADATRSPSASARRMFLRRSSRPPLSVRVSRASSMWAVRPLSSLAMPRSIESASGFSEIGPSMSRA